MPATYAYAPGKVILTGEHAVVYDQPAIAGPVNQVQAHAVVEANPKAESGLVRIIAPDISLDVNLPDLPFENPIATTIRNIQVALKRESLPSLTVRINSTIPIASGLGSGAAISVAICRALSTFLGSPLGDEEVSRIAFETDRYYHGTPSGIDNTVISHNRLVYFKRNQPSEMLHNPTPFWLVIADSGEKSFTGEVVGDLRKRMEKEPSRYMPIMEQIGHISTSARKAIENSDHDRLGHLLNENHALLQELAVSSKNLDRLVASARNAGALGAKLTGAGKGGNIIALVRVGQAEEITSVLAGSGAIRTIISSIPKS